MPRYKLVAMTKPKAGREAEYNEWYDKVHLPELVAHKGVKSAQRYKLAMNLAPNEPTPYLAIYDIEVDDLNALLGEMSKGTGASDALDLTAGFTVFYEELGPMHKQKA